MPEDIGGVAVSIFGDYSRLQSDLDKANQVAAAGGRAMAEAFTNGAGALVSFGAALTAGITVPLVGLAAASIQAAGSLEQTKIAFGTLLGSAQAAGAYLEELRQFAQRTPFEFNDLTRAAQRMMALGFESSQVLPTLRTIGDAVAAMGGNAAMIDRVTLALGQMSAKGKVSAQEMNQLAEVGIPAWKILADTIGISIPEAMKKAEAGAISSAIAIPAILQGMNAKFAGAMEDQSKTLLGSWSNIADRMEAILQDLGTAILPIAVNIVQALDPILEAVKQAVEWFSKLPAPIQMAAVAGLAFVAAIGPAIALMGGFGFAIQGITAALPALSAGLQLASTAASAMGIAFSGMAGVLGIGLIGALAAVTIGFYDLNQRTAETRRQMDALDQQFQEYISHLIKGAGAINSVEQAQEKINAALAAGALTAGEAAKALALLEAQAKKLDERNLKESMAGFSLGLTIVKDAAQAAVTPIEALSVKTKALRDAVEVAKTEMDKAVITYRTTGKGADDAAKAYDNWQAATKALQGTHEKIIKPLRDAHIATREFVEITAQYPDSAKAAATQAEALAIAVNRQANELAHAQRWLEHVMQQYRSGKATINDVTAALELLTTKQNAANKAMGEAPTSSLKLWQQHINEAAAAASKFLPALEALPPPIRTTELLLAEMGVKLSETGDILQSKLIAAYRELGTHNVTLEQEAAAWAKISGAVDKLAKTDLPAAIALYNQHNEQVLRLATTTKELLDAQQQRLQGEIALKEITGASATSEIIGLEQIRLKQEALYNSTHSLGELVVDVQRSMWEGWHMVLQGISDALIEGKNFGDTMEKVGRQILKMIMDDLVNFAFRELKKAFIGVDSSIKEATASWNKFAKSIADAFKPAGGGVGTPGPGGAGGGAGGITGALDIAGSIASIVTAISSIFGNFQMAAINKSLDLIVNHTLRQFNVTEQWYTASQDWFGQMFTRVGEIYTAMVFGFEAVVAALEGTRNSTRPTVLPPSAMPDIPGIPELPSVSGGTYATSNTSNKSSIGSITFHVNQVSNPRETAREIASTLKTISPRFAAYST
jgi:tape measure domain-containing protein